MQFSTKAEFIHVPDWYRGVEYLEEQKEDMIIPKIFYPGFFELKVKKGDEIVFSASTKEENPRGLKGKFSRMMTGKIPRNCYINCLRNAAQFVEKEETPILLVIHGSVRGEGIRLSRFPE